MLLDGLYVNVVLCKSVKIFTLPVGVLKKGMGKSLSNIDEVDKTFVAVPLKSLVINGTSNLLVKGLKLNDKSIPILVFTGGVNPSSIVLSAVKGIQKASFVSSLSTTIL